MDDSIQLQAEGNYLEITMTGKLTKEMYEQFVPAVEKQIQEQGKLVMVFRMHDFHGWTAGALWEDLKFDLHHWRDIQRLAIVGETKWQKGMAVFCKPFTTAKIKYFDHEKLDEARQWVKEEE
ncbi:MAG: STAS/SEC14 domain-containing protein [Pirellulales bacterium]|nr:STAS/SEC14 domain-containing protein [Pirellulales bacterium]